jgi:hypothetical protein
MNPITADIQQSIVHTIYALFIHNYIVFAYFFGFLLSVLVSFKKPSRFSVLLLLGFAVLTFSFEYDKHIIDGFRQQTLQSLATAEPHLGFQRFVSVLITDVFPVAFYLLGWGLIFIAIVTEGLKKTVKKV